jgi:hypothetical protein
MIGQGRAGEEEEPDLEGDDAGHYRDHHHPLDATDASALPCDFLALFPKTIP